MAKTSKRWTCSSLSNLFRLAKRDSDTNVVRPNQISALQSQDTPETPKAFKPGAALEQPNPQVVNFLILLLKAAVTKSGIAVIPAGCPNKGDGLLEILKQLPKFKTAEQLTKALKKPRTKGADVLSWICDTYGATFFLATDSLRIPGFGEDVQQFVLVKPVDAGRQERFEQEMDTAKGKSKLLFHGTSLDNLLSIMTNGFKSSHDTRFGAGCFMGEKPRTAYTYAHHRACLKRENPTSKYTTDKWEWRPTRDRAIVLGCQVAGKGRSVNDTSEWTGGVHVVTNLQSIAPRYVFLLPEKKYADRKADYKAPERAAVKDAMVEAFKSFPRKKQRDEASTREHCKVPYIPPPTKKQSEIVGVKGQLYLPLPPLHDI